MRLTRQEAEECKALVIDSNPTSRSILMNMLRDIGIGIGQVSQTSRVTDVRRELENRESDIVLCDYHFDNSPMSGQDLLGDLRRSQLPPYATVFVMVTGECSYTKVAEATESALDSYLIKPRAASALEERVLQARRRKKVLRSIFKAIEAGDFAAAARLCVERHHARAEFWLTEIAQRYWVSKASFKVMCDAAANDEVYAVLIHEGQHGISSMAEKATAHSLSGSPAAAVESLMAKGADTLNTKLNELAAAVLHRHAAKTTDHATLAGRINELQTRNCSQGTQINQGQVSSRSAGGLTLRA